MCLWRVLMKSDSRWLSDSCQYSAIHNAHLTSLHSDTICPVGIQIGSIHQAQKWDLSESKLGSLDHSRQTCLVHKQTGIAHHAQQQIWPDSFTSRAAQNREKNNKATRRDDFRQRPGRNILNRHVVRKLDYTSRFTYVSSQHSLPTTLSHNSKVTTIGVNVVIIGYSFQQFFMRSKSARSVIHNLREERVISIEHYVSCQWSLQYHLISRWSAEYFIPDSWINRCSLNWIIRWL